MARVEPDDRIFVYLRVRSGERVLSRSKVRELRALGGLLAEFMADSVIAGAPQDLEPGAEVRVEYVDASNGEPLVGFEADRDRGELVVSGRIPDRYRARMLGQGADGTSISREEFERRAGAKLGEEAAHELADEAFRSKVDLMALIERAIDATGMFVVRLPMGGP